MSEFLKNLAQMFFEILLNNLNIYDQVKQSIDLVNEKTLHIDCIYNILQDEFVAFQNYIVNALKKN